MYRVLLIDDERLVLASLRRRIPWESCGFTVCGQACSAREGLEKIRELQPELVFTDIRMPGVSGLDLIQQGRSFLRSGSWSSAATASSSMPSGSLSTVFWGSASSPSTRRRSRSCWETSAASWTPGFRRPRRSPRRPSAPGTPPAGGSGAGGPGNFSGDP